MLDESFAVATEDPEKPSNRSNTGVHFHELQPATRLDSTLKKSSIKAHCLAISQTHVFAAQAEKAVIHVYSRERRNQEAIVPFPDKVRSIALAGHEHGTGALIVGTEGGGLILWELSSGRQISTSKYHLKAVTCLAVDVKSQFLLSGSSDSNIHVWSLSKLVSFSSPSNRLGQDESLSPLQTLSDHAGSTVVDVAFGHGASRRNIAVSVGSDRACRVWDPQEATQLASYLLPAAPMCVVLDPLDRAAYVGLDDGSIQMLDFYQPPSLIDPLHGQDSGYAKKVNSADRWSLNEEECPSLLCLAVSYDGSTLVSGHQNGTVHSWSVGGSRHKQIADFAAPVTNIAMLKPTGFVNTPRQPVKLHQVTKPRYDDFAKPSSRGMPPEWTVNVQLMGTTHSARSDADAMSPLPAIQQAMEEPGWPRGFLESSLAQFQAQNRNTPAQDPEALADLQKQNADLTRDLEASKQAASELARREKRRRRADEIKAAKKRKRRERERLLDNISRKKQMGESLEGPEVEMEDAAENNENLSSDTDELTDVN